MGLNEAIFHGHVTGTDMLPSRKVFAVEKLFPFISLRVSRRREAEQEHSQCETQHRGTSKAAILHQSTGLLPVHRSSWDLHQSRYNAERVSARPSAFKTPESDVHQNQSHSSSCLGRRSC